MRTVFVSSFIVAGLFLARNIQAQGTVYLSNLDQSSANTLAIGSNSWLAQGFIPNTHSFILNSVQLLLGTTVGNPGDFTVSIYADSSSYPRRPAVLVGNLTGSTPSTAGVYTYTASGITLLSGFNYFIVATAATPITDGSYLWSQADSSSYSTSQWYGAPGAYTSSNGINWVGTYYLPFQFAIFATPVPEPSPAWLLWLGGGVLFYVRKLQSKLPLCGLFQG